MKVRVVFVTDPMCSWCWGMADDFDKSLQTLDEQVDFDLMLGGINTHGTQPIGDYGRRFLFRLWREVADTTGQKFGFQLPDEYIHNSARTCLAIEAMRELSGTIPFGYLHSLQRRFFVYAEDITQEQLLVTQAVDFGADETLFRQIMNAPGTLERVRFQFENATLFGTQALPSLLVEQDGRLQLLAGGYVDAEMFKQIITPHLGAIC